MRNRLIASTALAFVAYVACIGQAFAANLTWTNPTAYSDGSPLVAADIASTTIEYSNTSPFGAVAGQVVVTGSASAGVAPDPAAGATRCYRAKTTVVASKGGQTSDPSNVACKTVPFPKPNPPTNFLEQLVAWLKSIFSRFA